MILMWLIGIENNKIRYYYQVEGKGKKGIIEVDKGADKEKEEHRVICPAEDTDSCLDMKVVRRIFEYIAEDKFPEKVTLAWY